MMRPACLYLLALASALPGADWQTSKAEGDRKYRAGDYDAAFERYHDALAAAPSATVEAAGLRLDLGKVLWLKGDYVRAQAVDEQALTIYLGVYGAEHPAIARALRDIGMALYGAGDYAGARPYLEQALQIARKTVGAGDADTIDILQKLASNFARAGDYAKARTLQEEALADAQRSLGPTHPLTAQALRVLGQTLIELGDVPGAERIQLNALAILESRTGPDAVEVGDLLIMMGIAAKEAGSFKIAEEYFLRAASIYEKRLGPRNTKVGGALDNLGQDYVAMRRFDDARKALERALEIQRSELGPRHPWTGNLIQGLAKVEAATGNYAKARDLYEQNLDIWREKLGPSHPFTVVSLTLLADVQAHLGQYGAALDTALGAAAIRRDDIAFTVQGVDERQALRYADLHTASMDTALTLAARADATSADRVRVWDALIRSRALVLDEMAARHRSIRRSDSADVAGLAREVAASRSLMAKTVLQGRGGMSPKDYAAAMEKARGELDGAEFGLAQKSAVFRRELGMRQSGYRDVRASLPAGSALVAFRRYSRRNYAAPGDSRTEAYIAFVLAADREPAAIPLGSASHIEDLVTRWRAEIDRERAALGRSARANEQQYRGAAQALKAAVWDPLAHSIGTARRVYIVPDGSLQFVNFAALPAADGGYLVESGPLLHVLSAERDLAAPGSSVQAKGMLAVANPAFAGPAGKASTLYRGGHSSCGDFARMNFGNLPGSQVEADSIVAIWRARGWPAVELTGAQATESAVKRLSAGKQVVHLATHGFFLDANCPENIAARENPLLRAGLAFSGANHRATTGREDEDGVLTAEEAASLDLESAEWVVLSGCDTGVGDVRTGEGVLGLRRAFLEAGARTLIGSLWPVGDQDANQWMTSLYRARFVERKSTAEAIRDAGLVQLRARRRDGRSTHPFYWAGFLAVGDWR